VFCKSWRRAARSTHSRIEDALLTDVLRWEFNSQEVFNESIKIRQNYNCGQGYPHCCKGFYLFIPASAGRCKSEIYDSQIEILLLTFLNRESSA
jgi:hypothetical protein